MGGLPPVSARGEKHVSKMTTNFVDSPVASGIIYFDAVFCAILSGNQWTCRQIVALRVLLRLSLILTSKTKSNFLGTFFWILTLCYVQLSWNLAHRFLFYAWIWNQTHFDYRGACNCKNSNFCIFFVFYFLTVCMC